MIHPVISIQQFEGSIGEAKCASALSRNVYECNNFFEFNGQAKDMFYLKTSEKVFRTKKKNQFFLKAVIGNNDSSKNSEKKIDEKMVGIVGIHEIDRKIHLRSFFVDPKFQKMGIGRKLFTSCLNEVKKRFPSEKVLWIKSVKGSVGAYLNFGCVGCGELERDEFGFLHKLMKFEM